MTEDEQVVLRNELAEIRASVTASLDGQRRSNYILYGFVAAMVVLVVLVMTGKINANRQGVRENRVLAHQAKAAAASAKAAVLYATAQASTARAQAQQALASQARATASADRSCEVQARGLRVGHELLGVIEGLHAILTLPLSPSQRARQRQGVPRSVVRRSERIIKGLNGHLATYDRLERKQPQTRRC